MICEVQVGEDGDDGEMPDTGLSQMVCSRSLTLCNLTMYQAGR